jgi:hypothetical protein
MKTNSAGFKRGSVGWPFLSSTTRPQAAEISFFKLSSSCLIIPITKTAFCCFVIEKMEHYDG